MFPKNPLSRVDPLGLLCPPGDPMCEIANRAAGIPGPDQSIPPPSNQWSVSANLQIGTIKFIPIGISFQCTYANGRFSGYFGAGIVVGANVSFNPRVGDAARWSSGDPTGWGFRGNLTSPGLLLKGPPSPNGGTEGLGATASYFTNVSGTGSSFTAGGQWVGGTPSGGLTYGRAW